MAMDSEAYLSIHHASLSSFCTRSICFFANAVPGCDPNASTAIDKQHVYDICRLLGNLGPVVYNLYHIRTRGLYFKLF